MTLETAIRFPTKADFLGFRDFVASQLGPAVTPHNRAAGQVQEAVTNRHGEVVGLLVTFGIEQKEHDALKVAASRNHAGVIL